MTKLKSLMAATATIALVSAWPLIASAQATQDPHHPAGDSAAQPPTPQPQTPAGSGMMGGQKGMAGGSQGMSDNMSMMNMMNMMNMMGMAGRGGPAMEGCGPGATGMATVDRVEGRIAFLRTELKITEAQREPWDAFADALRANAKKLGELRASMMPQAQSGESQPPTMATRLDFQEHWLAARLEGTRAMKSVFIKLYDTLSGEQKKTADELLAPHMGMGGAAMMPMGGPRQ